MIYKNNKKVKKYTLNWSREARKESITMFLTMNTKTLGFYYAQEFNNDNFIDNRIVEGLDFISI